MAPTLVYPKNEGTVINTELKSATVTLLNTLEYFQLNNNDKGMIFYSAFNFFFDMFFQLWPLNKIVTLRNQDVSKASSSSNSTVSKKV